MGGGLGGILNRNITETDVLIKYSYSVQSTANNFYYFEDDLKMDMFQVLANMVCRLRRLLSLGGSDSTSSSKLDENQIHRNLMGNSDTMSSTVEETQTHRNLEALSLKSSSRDANIGQCTPTHPAYYCAKYEGLVLAKINNVGENSSPDEITKNVYEYLKFYTEHKDFTQINETIVEVTLLAVTQVGQDPSMLSKATAGMTTGTRLGTVSKVSIAAGCIALTSLIFAMLVMVRRRDNRKKGGRQLADF